MKQHIQIAIIAFGIIGILGACQKKDNTPAQPAKVVINVSSPANGQLYRKGDSVYINASVSYISELHGYELQLKNKNTGDVLYATDEHVHSDAFTIKEAWLDTLSAATDLQLEITAEIDHEGNGSQAEIEFKSQP